MYTAVGEIKKYLIGQKAGVPVSGSSMLLAPRVEDCATKCGAFRHLMRVNLENDGPVTLAQGTPGILPERTLRLGTSEFCQDDMHFCQTMSQNLEFI